MKKAKGIFVAGTGTDVGKTYVTALLTKRLKEESESVCYYKAALSGADCIEGSLVPGDACYVKEVAELENESVEMVSYVYQHAYSPHLAAKIEGNPLELSVVKKGYEKLERTCDYVVVEGSGGIVCPLRYDEKKIFLEDVISMLDLPCIIVADAGLGTINATMLTIHYMESKGMKINGIILNHYQEGDICHEDNKKMIEELANIPVIACVKEEQTFLDIKTTQLLQLFSE